MNARTLTRSACALVLAMALAGCVVSVEPLIPESEAMFDEGLLGTWEDEDGNRLLLKGSKVNENSYWLSYTSNGNTITHMAHLGRLGEHLVLELFPDRPIRAHLLLVLRVVAADEVEWQALRPEALLAALEAGELELAHRRLRRDLVLRGSPAKLRAELIPWLAHPGALTEPRVLRRAQELSAAEPPVVPCLEASPWTEADRLFRSDPRWLGADAAASVDLGGGRILWLFGNSWVDAEGRGARHHARRVPNTIAVQSGADPSTAAIRFHWGLTPDGRPAGFLAGQGDEVLQPGSGVRLDDRLVLFLARLRKVKGSGLEPVGWTAMLVSNPDADPAEWRMRMLDLPVNPFSLRLGYTAALRLDGYVYALGAQHPLGSPPVYVARWPERSVRRGQLKRAEWWAGEQHGWVPEASLAPRRPLFEQGQAELSIHFDATSGQFLAAQTIGEGAADIGLRAAPALVGPWSEALLVYRPSEYYRPNVRITAARAHPAITGGDIVLTYTPSSTEYLEVLMDPAIHYPRFMRLTRCAPPPIRDAGAERGGTD
jgi:hypothetical protein